MIETGCLTAYYGLRSVSFDLLSRFPTEQGIQAGLEGRFLTEAAAQCIGAHLVHLVELVTLAQSLRLLD